MWFEDCECRAAVSRSVDGRMELTEWEPLCEEEPDCCDCVVWSKDFNCDVRPSFVSTESDVDGCCVAVETVLRCCGNVMTSPLPRDVLLPPAKFLSLSICAKALAYTVDQSMFEASVTKLILKCKPIPRMLLCKRPFYALASVAYNITNLQTELKTNKNKMDMKDIAIRSASTLQLSLFLRGFSYI